MSETFVPDTIEGVDKLLVSREWDKAAVVWAYVHCFDEKGGGVEDRANAKNSIDKPYTPESFAAKGFATLRSKDTVRKHWQRWQDAIDSGHAQPIKPGDPIPHVDLPWKEKKTALPEQANKKRRSRAEKPGGSRDPKLVAEIRKRREAGESLDGLKEQFGVSGGVLVTADSYVLGRMEGEAEGGTVDLNSLGSTAKKQVEAIERRIRKQLDKEYFAKIAVETARLKADAAKAIEDYQTELKSKAEKERAVRDDERRRYRLGLEAIKKEHALISMADYKLMLSCLHPDSRLSVSDERMATAFRLLNDPQVKLLLVKEG